MVAAAASIQTATLNKFIEAWKGQDVDGTVALWSEDFTQSILPSSLGVPSKSRDVAAMVYGGLQHSLSNWKLDVKEVVHDPTKGTAAVYASSTADLPFPSEQWDMDYAVFMSFSECGSKITRMNEMVDTSKFQQLFPKLQKHLMEKAGAKGH